MVYLDSQTQFSPLKSYVSHYTFRKYMFVKFFYLFLLTRLTGPAADSLSIFIITKKTLQSS